MRKILSKLSNVGTTKQKGVFILEQFIGYWVPSKTIFKYFKLDVSGLNLQKKKSFKSNLKFFTLDAHSGGCHGFKPDL